MIPEDYDGLIERARKSAESLRGCSAGLSPFLDEWGLSLWISGVPKSDGFHHIDSGGVTGAARRVAAYAGCIPSVESFSFVYLDIQPDTGLTRPEKEALFASLNELGISSEDVGDIFGHEAGYRVIALDRKTLFGASVNEVEAGGMRITKIDADDFSKYAKQAPVKDVTAASRRLDAVMCSCGKLSRSRAKKLIESNLAMVNYSIERKAEKQVDSGSVISGFGQRRIEIISIEGPTKKGRFRMKYSNIP